MARKNKKRRRWIPILSILVCILVVVGAIGALIGRYYLVRSKFTNVNFENLSPEERYRMVLELSEYADKDSRALDRRNTWYNDMVPTQFLGKKTWDIIFPLTYAGSKLVSQGELALPALLRLAEEQGSWLMVARFDDPRLLQLAVTAYQDGRVDYTNFGYFLGSHLPDVYNPLPAPGYGSEEKIAEWIQTNLSGKSYQEICLESMDILMQHKDPLTLSHFLGKRWVLRWLNRVGDYDLDDWLAVKAPEALAFRNRELKKGYDPAVAFPYFAGDFIEGMMDEGIKAVYPDTNDRKACRQLIEAVYGLYRSPLLVPRAEGWQVRLQQWYWENRHHLVYDFEKHRFVLKTDSEQIP